MAFREGSRYLTPRCPLEHLSLCRATELSTVGRHRYLLIEPRVFSIDDIIEALCVLTSYGLVVDDTSTTLLIHDGLILRIIDGAFLNWIEETTLLFYLTGESLTISLRHLCPSHSPTV